MESMSHVSEIKLMSSTIGNEVTNFFDAFFFFDKKQKFNCHSKSNTSRMITAKRSKAKTVNEQSTKD